MEIEEHYSQLLGIRVPWKIRKDALALAFSQETWGLVVNKALACGCPVVVAQSVGCAPDIAARIGEENAGPKAVLRVRSLPCAQSQGWTSCAGAMMCMTRHDANIRPAVPVTRATGTPSPMRSSLNGISLCKTA